MQKSSIEPPWRCLVTGGRGFIGKRVVERLLTIGAQVHAPTSQELDVRDPNQTEAFFRAVSPHCVFHLASTARGRDDHDDMDSVFKTNTVGSFNVLSSCIKSGVQRLILAGTGDETGSFDPGTKIMSGPKSMYAASKAAATLLYEAASRFSDLQPTVVRLFAVYGPCQSLDFFIPQAVNASLKGPRMAMTEGLQKRDFTWLDDVVQALIDLAKSDSARGQTLDLCTGRLHSLREVVEILSDLTGNQDFANLGEIPYRSAEPHQLAGDPARLTQLLGRPLSVDLKSGLALLLADQREQTP